MAWEGPVQGYNRAPAVATLARASVERAMGHVGNYKKAVRAWKQCLKKQIKKKRKLLLCMRSRSMVAKRLLEVKNELLREALDYLGIRQLMEALVLHQCATVELPTTNELSTPSQLARPTFGEMNESAALRGRAAYFPRLCPC